MKNVVLILLIIILITQILNLDFNHLFDFGINKRIYGQIAVVIFCLLAYLQEKKKG
jgi:hypothetical protein